MKDSEWFVIKGLECRASKRSIDLRLASRSIVILSHSNSPGTAVRPVIEALLSPRKKG